jgi:hypothetical protein
LDCGWIARRLLLLVSALFICYGGAGFLQEYAFFRLKFTHPTLMSFAIPFVSFVFGALGGGLRDRKGSLKLHVVVGLLSCATVSFSNMSLMYLNYPTQIICKSSKAGGWLRIVAARARPRSRVRVKCPTSNTHTRALSACRSCR